MEKEPSEALVAACLDGDLSAFDALLVRHQKPVYNLCLRMLNDSEDARDATQSTFLKAYENLNRFDASRKFFSWIYRIAINECLDTRQRTRSTLEFDDDIGTSDFEPDTAAITAQSHKRLEGALMNLTPEHRSVVVLHYKLGLSLGESAQVLDTRAATVKSRLHEARKKLRGMLSQDQGE